MISETRCAGNASHMQICLPLKNKGSAAVAAHILLVNGADPNSQPAATRFNIPYQPSRAANLLLYLSTGWWLIFPPEPALVTLMCPLLCESHRNNLLVVCCLQDPNAKAGKFGFAVDNTIGATPQPNGWMDNWVDFYRERRIRHQLKLLGGMLLARL